MLTIKQIRQLAFEKYTELWGREWVQDRISTLYEFYGEAENGVLEYNIAQDDALAAPVPPFLEFFKTRDPNTSETPPQHVTKFEIDLQAGGLKVLSHY